MKASQGGGALGLSCTIVRPIEGVLDSQAASCLLSESGFSSSQVKNFTFEEILKCRAAYSETGSSIDECRNVYTSYSYSVIEGLNIAGIITADRIVARVAQEYPLSPHPGEEISFAITGSYFDNLIVAGHKIDLNLSTNIFHELDTYTKLDQALRNGRPDLLAYGGLANLSSKTLHPLKKEFPGLSGLAEAAREFRANKFYGDGHFWCTAAGHLVIEQQFGNMGLRNFGSIILVPRFGLISLGELVVDRFSRSLQMLRLDLGSPLEGRFAIGLSNLSSLPIPEMVPQKALGSNNAQIALANIDSVNNRLSESKRFTDISLLRGHLYPGDIPTAEMHVADTELLIKDNLYTLEVAIRAERRGINAKMIATHPIHNPRYNQEDIVIFVEVFSYSSAVSITEPLASVVWPHDSDSSLAFFRMHVKSQTAYARLEVRLYDSNLDLLDAIDVSLAISSKKARKTLPKHQLSWDEDVRPLYLDKNSKPRSVVIEIIPQSDSYKFKFIFKKNDKKEIRLWISPPVSLVDIELLLARTRNFWTKLVVTTYAERLSASAMWEDYLQELADLGTDAWRLIFGNRASGQKGASETMGDLWAAMDLQVGTPIQISYNHEIKNFIFPWSIVFPPHEKDTIDPLHFWGAQYQIEQVREGPKNDGLADDIVSVAFMLDENFGSAEEHRKTFEQYKNYISGTKLEVTSPITDESTFFDQLTPAAHLYYFFCHGYAPAHASTLRNDGLKVIRNHIENVKDPDTRKVLDTWIGLQERMAEASIFLGKSEISESKLNKREFFAGRRPVIFLNMCHSADLLPSMNTGLVNLFLQRDASAVLGTESIMTSVFAHEFGVYILNELFARHDIGSALWNARRHFLNNKNPLGLAYTLYGRATVCLGASSIVDVSS